jgi:hypothetical protein
VALRFPPHSKEMALAEKGEDLSHRLGQLALGEQLDSIRNVLG